MESGLVPRGRRRRPGPPRPAGGWPACRRVRADHGGQSGRVADGPEGGHRRLPAQRIGVAGVGRGQPGQRWAPPRRSPRSPSAHAAISTTEASAIVQSRRRCPRRGGTRPARTPAGAPPAPVGQGRAKVLVAERAEPVRERPSAVARTDGRVVGQARPRPPTDRPGARPAPPSADGSVTPEPGGSMAGFMASATPASDVGGSDDLGATTTPL